MRPPPGKAKCQMSKVKCQKTIDGCVLRLSLRREWGLAPLGGAAARFTGCSEDPIRPRRGEGA